MAIKSEISWKRRTDDGDRLEVYARRTGGEWQFYQRHGRYEVWQLNPTAPLADWLQLEDAIRRRIARRLYPPAELDRIRREIRSRFPGEIG